MYTGLCVKSYNFVGTKFRGLTMMDMFMDTSICGFHFFLFHCDIKFVDYTILEIHEI